MKCLNDGCQEIALGTINDDSAGGAECNECIFHCDKNHFLWTECHTEEFWAEIRKKTKEENLNFAGFIFPGSPKKNRSYNFFDENHLREFTTKADFQDATFTAPITFDFIFRDDANFFNTSFNHNVYFLGCTFQKWSCFAGTTFSGIVLFENCNFNHSTGGFSSIKIENLKQFIFRNCKGSIGFTGLTLDERFEFKNTDLGKMSFLGSNIYSANFNECSFLLGENKQKVLYDEVLIRNPIDIKIKKYTFKEAIKDRINYIKKTLKKEVPPTAKNFEEVENLYRQFKKNFDTKKDFHTADEFYVGEMEMMRQKLKREELISFSSLFIISSLIAAILININDIWNAYPFVLVSIILIFTGLFIALFLSYKLRLSNIGRLIILNLYENISHYNHSPIRALSVLILLIIGVGAWQYVFLNINFINNVSIENIVEFSTTNSIPFLEFTNQSLKTELMNIDVIKYSVFIQKITTGSVLLLFALSLRRKFRR